MSKFTPTRRSNNCPICGDSSGDCRIVNDELVLCHSGVDRDANVAGWKYLHADKSGVWGVYVPDTDKEGRSWQDIAEERNQRRQREREQQQAKSLPVSERNKHYREIAKKLTLSQKHRQHLTEHRGLTETEIDFAYKQGWLRTWQPGLDVFGVDGNLAGVSGGLGFKQSLVGVDGFIIAALDVHGNITGHQIATDDREKFGKYLWLSSASKGGSSPHLNGELPLFIWKHPEAKVISEVYFAEGGLKSLHVALKLWSKGHTDIVVIGAAGGQFAGSPELLKAVLDLVVSPECLIYPDAGAVGNRHIMRQYRKLYQLLSECGYGLNVAWWGQVSKDAPDVDELSHNAKITRISWQEFSGDEPLTEPDQAEYEAYNQRVEEEEQAAEAAHKEQQRQWREQFPERAKHAWNKVKQFNPTHRINNKYFDFEVPSENYLIGVRSGLGTGKTEWIKRAVELLHDEGWLALGYRNSLLLQSSERWDFSHLHLDQAIFLIKDSKSKLACCVDSLGHFEPEDFEDKNLILDEVMSIILHLLVGNTIRDRRCKILDLFTEAVKRAKRVFILDGMLADWAVQYISDLRGTESVIKVSNEFKSEPFKINFYLGAIVVDELRPNDKSPLIARIKQSAEPIVICSDSQHFCEAEEEILIKAGFKGIRVDRKTVGDKRVKEFLKNPDRWIKNNKPDYIILSPSAESGLDISIKDYFFDQYCFFFGVISVDAMRQFLGRIRDFATQRWIWCAEVGLSDSDNLRSPFPSQFEKALQQFLVEDGLRVIEGLDNSDAIAELMKNIIQSSQDIHHKVYTQLKATANYERSNLRQCLLESLIEDGHDVETFTEERDFQAAREYKKSSNQVKDQNSKGLFNAPDIDPSKIEVISRSTSITWEDQCAVDKAKLKRRLPGIEDTPNWTVDFIRKVKYDKRQFIDGCELWWLLQHPEAAKLQQRERWHWLFKSEKVFLGDIRSQFSRVSALEQLGILKLIESRATWTDDSPELIELVKLGKNKRVASALGLSVGNSTPTSYLRRVLRLVGLKLQTERIRDEGDRVGVCSIDAASLYDPDREAVIECVDRRLQKYVTGDIAVMDWEAAPKNANCHTPTPAQQPKNEVVPLLPINQPEIQPQQVLEPDQVFTNLYNKNSKTWTDTNEPTNTPTGTMTDEDLQDILENLEGVECAVTASAVLGVFPELPDAWLPVIWEKVSPDRREQLSLHAAAALMTAEDSLEIKQLFQAFGKLPQEVKHATWERIPWEKRTQLSSFRLKFNS